MYVAPATRNEIRIFFLLSMASILAPLLIAWDLHRFDNVDQILPWSVSLLGVAHTFVLVGLLRFIRIDRIRASRYVIFCMLFPIWGLFVGGCGLFWIFFPLPIILCSLIWGCVLSYLLENKYVIAVFFVVGLAPLITLYSVSIRNGNGIPEWYLEGIIVLWHVPASFAIFILGLRRRSVLSKLSTARCQACGYDCVGIEEQRVCPECGGEQIGVISAVV